jgi:hypothetical protein
MPLWERQKVQNLLHEKVSHCDDEGMRMAKKKPTSAADKAKLIADQAAGLAEFAATALVAAEQLRIKTRAIEQFPLEETELAIVAHLPALPAKIKTKLAKKNAHFTLADTASILLTVADSFLDAEAKQQLTLVMVARKLMDCLQENVVKYADQAVTRRRRRNPPERARRGGE